MTSNDQPWNKIFETLGILKCLEDQSFFQISARQINEIGQREARLMAKFDTKESLPEVFKASELNINAISNGNYIIFKDPQHQSFINLPDYTTIIPQKVAPQLDFSLDTLVFNSRMSESGAIDFAHHSKLLATYTGEKNLKLTTRGRFFSDGFAFQLNAVGNVDVKGVQIEVDAGYEGEKQFLIIEAKSSTRSTFNIRQLYYPLRHFQSKTKKDIRTLLLSFSNGVYFFTEIQLSPNYYDYRITNNVAFEIVVPEVVKKLTVVNLLEQETHIPEGIPVPQADDLNKVIDLVAFLVDNPSDKFAIAEHFEFHERQGDYYGNASCYISLTIKEGVFFKVTEIGKKLSTLQNRENRNIAVVQAILQTRLFNDLVRLYFDQGKDISDQQIINRIAQEEGLSGSTPARRKSTIRSWLMWVVTNLPKE